MEFTLTAGQKIHGEPGLNNKDIQGLENGLLKGEVTKVGIKYIYVMFNGRTYKYWKKDLRQVTDYMPDFYLTLDSEEYAERHELSSNLNEIKKYLSQSNKITREQTRKILEILRSED